ncbi:MAG: hypothetical protein K6F32_01965 [Bacilli bacterium]|nr:hypothetical protein [Bacilli bacterium]
MFAVLEDVLDRFEARGHHPTKIHSFGSKMGMDNYEFDFDLGEGVYFKFIHHHRKSRKPFRRAKQEESVSLTLGVVTRPSPAKQMLDLIRSSDAYAFFDAMSFDEKGLALLKIDVDEPGGKSESIAALIDALERPVGPIWALIKQLQEAKP